MAPLVTAQSLFQQQFSPARLAFGAILTTVTAAVSAGLFTTIGPVGGAIFGVSEFLSNRFIHGISDEICRDHDTLIFKVTRFALSTIGGIAAGVLMTTAVGFPMTMMTGVILSLVSMGITIATLLTLGGCLCSSAIITGVALAADEKV